jgi:hypothetical protein
MPKLKILFVSANSIPSAPLKVEDEYKEVLAKVRPSKNWDIRHNPSATLKEVVDEIKLYKPDIVHFSAHGSPSEKIVLNNQAGKPKSVSTKALEQLFKIMKGNVRLVVMNSCYSAAQARAIAKFVNCVCGVRLTLEDDLAIVFSQPFYEALIEGKSVAAAYDTAMILVYAEDPDKQQVPRLFKGSVPPEEIFFSSARSRTPSLRKRDKKPAPRGSVDTTRSKVSRVASVEDRTGHRPPPGENNFWYKDRQTDQAIVFVHGVLSDSRDCWYREPSNHGPAVYWPDLLSSDHRVADYSIYLGGYHTNAKAPEFEVRDCAEELYTALKRRPEVEGARSVMDRKTIIFVCHSMGGIVVRYMLSYRFADEPPKLKFNKKRIGLVLFASPSSGSPWANRLDLLLDYFKHQQGVELKWGSWKLKDFKTWDDRFRRIVRENRIPKLLGSEAYEHKFGKWLASVERNPGGAFFKRSVILPDTDHFNCVKPEDRRCRSYAVLVDFCDSLSRDETVELRPILPDEPPLPHPTAVAEMVSGVPSRGETGEPGPTAATEQSFAVPTPVAQAVVSATCQSMHWDVKIDEEGDAYTEMMYKGIVLPPKRPYVFELPPGEVQSGHTTEYELIRDDRTTEGASLKRGNIITPTMIKMSVAFSNRPTSNSPSGFAVRCWDWNVYSMNMEEYRQKPGWSEDGLDYAEKYVPEQWQNFTMLVQFPPQIVFAKRPFFEIYNPDSSADQVRNDELTFKCQCCFYYSNSLNQAVLSVQLPPSPFSYRISWLLGESRVMTALIPTQRQRQRIFAKKLLLMRRMLEADKDERISEAKELEQGVNSVLASMAEHVQRLLGDAKLDPSNLEISLMVLDEDQPEMPPRGIKKLPVLRIVAGTLLADPGYRALAFFVGDGNAGRAWKRRIARVFDLNEKDPKSHVYVPIPGSPGHRFLVSIPLIDPDSDALVYGILNFGTFTDEQAELLRKIGAPQEVQSMTNYVQSYVLKRLIELVKL